MTSLNRTALVLGFAALAFAACGSGSLDGAGGGHGGAAGTGGTTGTGGTGGCAPARVSSSSAVPPEHRATAKTCSPSNAPPSDGGTISCATDADCTPDGGLPWGYNTCLHGVCSFDQCLTDADCGSGVCGCSSDYYGGNAAYHPNVCVSGNCRVDADCGGAGGYCSPSRGYCGAFQGFYCHGPSDSCVDSTSDCAACGNACVYAPTVGAFVCGMAICAG
jgi:hypothetical protein